MGPYVVASWAENWRKLIEKKWKTQFQGKIINFQQISMGCPNFFDTHYLNLDSIVNQEQKIFPRPLLEFLELVLAYLKIIISPPVYNRSSSFEPKFVKLLGVPKLFLHSVGGILDFCPDSIFWPPYLPTKTQ